MSSLAGRMGGYGNGVGYAATKAGIVGLSMSMARRVAPFNITVNAIAPGTTESEILKSFTPERIAELKKMVPLGRLGKPGDIAALCAFLASEQAGFITGAVIDINGGMFMG
jgi:NAD(P)-dependent dehydrogenase (short-subunit alcohol dehydrogenase family)